MHDPVGIPKAPGVKGRPAILWPLLVAMAACDSNVLGPEALSARRCDPPPMLIAGAQPQPFALGALREALLHAAGPMTAALGSSSEVDQLRKAMNGMANQDDRVTDTACRLIFVASDALTALPPSPETLPDRDGIRLVLMLAAGVVKAGQ
jgi:hypothetical protein